MNDDVGGHKVPEGGVHANVRKLTDLCRILAQTHICDQKGHSAECPDATMPHRACMGVVRGEAHIPVKPRTTKKCLKVVQKGVLG